MNDDLEFTRIAAAASSTEGERRPSFREEIEQLFAEYAATLRDILGSREVAAQREQESTRSRSGAGRAQQRSEQKEADERHRKADVNEQEAPCDSQPD